MLQGSQIIEVKIFHKRLNMNVDCPHFVLAQSISLVNMGAARPPEVYLLLQHWG